MANQAPVILASQSPRRQELLRFLCSTFEIRVSDVDETISQGVSPADAVELLARRKAEAVARDFADALVIGADTVVAIDGLILGKPCGSEEAAAMLRRLSGRTHQVYTGVCLCRGEKRDVFHCCTDVEFSPLTEEEIGWYLATGEPFDKAGAYGIQGFGARFIRRIAGDFYNVMGLPVNLLYARIGNIDK